MVLVFWQILAKLDTVIPAAPLSQVQVTAVGDDESDRAKVAQEIMQVRKKKGGLKVVQGRGLQLGDAALIDFDAKRSDTGEEFAGAKRRKTHMDTDSADMQFLPGKFFDLNVAFVTGVLFLWLLPCCGHKSDSHMLLALCTGLFEELFCLQLMFVCCMFCSRAVFG